jgi:hypothetical protein
MVTMKKSVTMEAVKSLLLEWDGDGSGLEAVETEGGTLYKVADVIVQNEDIPGMTVTDNEGKETLVTDSIYNDMISRSLVGDGFAAKVAGYVYLAQKEAQAPGAELPGGGIWLLKKQDGSYPKKVVLPAYREAFLQGEKPDGEKGESMGGGVTSWNDLKDRPFEDTRKTVTTELVTVTGVTIGQYVKVADSIDFDINTLTHITRNSPNDSYVYENEPVYLVGNDIITMSDDTAIAAYFENQSQADAYYPFPSALTPGLYMYVDGVYGGSEVSVTYSLTYGGGELKTLDPKFLPNPSDLSAEWIAALKTALGI